MIYRTSNVNNKENQNSQDEKMLNILFCGAAGRMGRATAELVEKDDNITICAGVDIADGTALSFPIYKRINDVKEPPDVIIDFSNHALLPDIVSYAVKNRIPAVICTTGHSLDELAIMRDASAKIPIFYSRNMSLGINLTIELAKLAACALGGDYDVEIVEAHHNQKLDAPSGTALMIADAVNKALGGKEQYIYDRHDVRRKRGKDEIGIHSIRAGSIVGEHTIIFGGDEEILKISHSATSRSVFASGALSAAKFIVNMPNGMYDMGDIIRKANC